MVLTLTIQYCTYGNPTVAGHALAPSRFAVGPMGGTAHRGWGGVDGHLGLGDNGYGNVGVIGV